MHLGYLQVRAAVVRSHVEEFLAVCYYEHAISVAAILALRLSLNAHLPHRGLLQGLQRLLELPLLVRPCLWRHLLQLIVYAGQFGQAPSIHHAQPHLAHDDLGAPARVAAPAQQCSELAARIAPHLE